MSKITSLKAGKSRQKRVNLFLDGKYAFSLEAELAVQEGLRVGQELSVERLEELKGSDSLQRCLNAANHLLGYRPRSESELLERLQKRGFKRDIIEAVLSKLKECGLVDDSAFARFWQDNRSTFSPRSKWLTGRELRRKGVDSDIIIKVTGEVDDAESAYHAAQSRVQRLPCIDYQLLRRRLGGFLRRRGFSYEVISHVIEQIWKEYGSSS